MTDSGNIAVIHEIRMLVGLLALLWIVSCSQPRQPMTTEPVAHPPIAWYSGNDLAREVPSSLVSIAIDSSANATQNRDGGWTAVLRAPSGRERFHAGPATVTAVVYGCQGEMEERTPAYRGGRK